MLSGIVPSAFSYLKSNILGEECLLIEKITLKPQNDKRSSFYNGNTDFERDNGQNLKLIL